MKKILYLALTFAVMGLASCGNKNGANTELGDTVAVDTLATTEANADNAEALVNMLAEKLNANDAAGMAALSQQAQQKIAELIKAGKTEEAQKYASQIKKFIDDNAEKVKTISSGNTTIADLVNTVSATTPEDLAKSAAAAVQADANHEAEQLKEDGQAKANEIKEAAKAKANEQVSKASTKANEAVTNAQNKANQAVSNAQSKANQKVNDATNSALKKIGL